MKTKSPSSCAGAAQFLSVCCYGILTFQGLSFGSELGNRTFTILKAIRANNPYANTKHKMIKRRFMGVCISPDNLHKDNTGGGEPYGLQLPNPSADFVLMYERHNMLFVPYLRLAILHWGGFPGLEGRGIPFEPLEKLVAELELF